MESPQPEPGSKPTSLFVFVSDLLFSVKIETVARRLGYDVTVIDDPQRLPAQFPGEADPLLACLAQAQPGLLIFDLSSPAIPWREWIPRLKAAEATQGIPVLCFGSHVDVDALQAAKIAGAQAVVARSRIAAALPELIQKYARQ